MREEAIAINMMHSGRRCSCYDILPFAVPTVLQSPALAAFLKAFAGEKWRYGEGVFVSSLNVFSISHNEINAKQQRLCSSHTGQKLAKIGRQNDNLGQQLPSPFLQCRVTDGGQER